MRDRDAAFAAFALDWHDRNAAEIEGDLTPEQELAFAEASRPLVASWAEKLTALG